MDTYVHVYVYIYTHIIEPSWYEIWGYLPKLFLIGKTVIFTKVFRKHKNRIPYTSWMNPDGFLSRKIFGFGSMMTMMTTKLRS